MLKWTPISEKIAKIRIGAKPQNITVFAIYAPTNQNTPERRDNFYASLKNQLRKVPKRDLVVAGDFNAQLGGTQAPPLGNFAQGTVCENGDRLLSSMGENRLIAKSILFS